MRVSKAYMAGLVTKEYVDTMAEKSKSITGYDIRRSGEKVLGNPVKTVYSQKELLYGFVFSYTIDGSRVLLVTVLQGQISKRKGYFIHLG
jgi:hypothetical protein